jgi:ferredoxin/flavodoxin---NADP+ reductase
VTTFPCIIVGGGPIGLYTAARLESEKIPYLLLEAESQLGGQPLTLYPEKDVVDVKMFPTLKAKQIVKALEHSLDPKNIRCNSPVLSIEEEKDKILVTTPTETIECRYLILATGLGFHKPRTMGLADEEKCRNIFYSLKNFEELKNQRIVIFGGGDSALDWAKQLSAISPYVSLVHRRREFRGDPKTIEGCKLSLYLPYIPFKIEDKDGLCREITIQNVETNEFITLPSDVVLVNFGQVPTPSTLGLPLNNGIFGVVAPNCQATPRIYVVGDCLFDPARKKRIQPGFEEVDWVISSLLSKKLF